MKGLIFDIYLLFFYSFIINIIIIIFIVKPEAIIFFLKIIFCSRIFLFLNHFKKKGKVEKFMWKKCINIRGEKMISVSLWLSRIFHSFSHTTQYNNSTKWWSSTTIYHYHYLFCEKKCQLRIDKQKKTVLLMITGFF